jgi:hypothetical protein
MRASGHIHTFTLRSSGAIVISILLLGWLQCKASPWWANASLNLNVAWCKIHEQRTRGHMIQTPEPIDSLSCQASFVVGQHRLCGWMAKYLDQWPSQQTQNADLLTYIGIRGISRSTNTDSCHLGMSAHPTTCLFWTSHFFGFSAMLSLYIWLHIFHMPD